MLRNRGAYGLNHATGVPTRSNPFVRAGYGDVSRHHVRSSTRLTQSEGQPDVLVLLKNGTLVLASGIEAAAAIVIGLAAAEAVAGAIPLFLRHPAQPAAKEFVRLRLGRWLALSLEFELAADILRTAVAPTWNEIGQLAAIIVLRTALNYFLQREIAEAARNPDGPPPTLD